MTSYAPAVYTGDGVTTDFAVPFGYLVGADLKVAVDGVDAAYTFLSAGVVQVSPAPASGKIVKLYRETADEARNVIFANAASLTGPQLNKSADQLFYMAQEAVDVAHSAMVLNSGDVFDAGGKRVVNISDPVADNDAATKGYITAQFSGAVTSVEASASAAAVSAAAAAVSKNGTDTNLAATLVAKNAAQDDAVLTAADRVAVAADKATVATDKGLVNTAKNAVDTAKDAIDTQAAAVAVARAAVDDAKAAADADVVLTHADVVLTHADVVLTNADKVGTAADRVQTGLDRVAAAASAGSINAANIVHVIPDSFSAAQQGVARSNIATVGAIRRQIFTSSNTYTPHAKMLFCFAQAQAPGGGGAGCAITAAGTLNGAGGGGSGSYSEIWLTKADIGASKAVTIGALGAGGLQATAGPGQTAGSVSLGALLTAFGGVGSLGASSASRTVGGIGGALGIGGLVTGRQGSDGAAAASLAVDGSLYGGAGADSVLGFGGRPTINGAGQSAVGYGGGGGGASDFNTTAQRGGGNGGPGIVIITEYCSE